MVDGYLNQDFRNGGYYPSTIKTFMINNPESWTVMCGTDGKNNSSNNPFKIGYEWLKANEQEFFDAIDI